jgi:dTDP-4-dehydrorhamnose 3,5-epimerase
MEIISTPIEGLLVIKPKVFEDARGYFYESYNAAALSTSGIDTVFRQDNQSRSKFGVIRGLHFQQNPHAQTKFVRVLEGEIYDVAVDIRKGSPTYGKHYGIVLSADNKLQLYIPHGFAHGFSVLSPDATVMYKCDNFYHPSSEGGIIYNDPSLGIDWMIPAGSEIISGKDQELPVLSDIGDYFQYPPAV